MPSLSDLRPLQIELFLELPPDTIALPLLQPGSPLDSYYTKLIADNPGAESLLTQCFRANLDACACLADANVSGALDALERVSSLRKMVFASDHPEFKEAMKLVLATMNDLAIDLIRSEQSGLAHRVLDRMLAKAEKELVGRERDVFRCIHSHNLAALHVRKKHYAAAQRCLHAALRGFARIGIASWIFLGSVRMAGILHEMNHSRKIKSTDENVRLLLESCLAMLDSLDDKQRSGSEPVLQMEHSLRWVSEVIKSVDLVTAARIAAFHNLAVWEVHHRKFADALSHVHASMDLAKPFLSTSHLWMRIISRTEETARRMLFDAQAYRKQAGYPEVERLRPPTSSLVSPPGIDMTAVLGATRDLASDTPSLVSPLSHRKTSSVAAPTLSRDGDVLSAFDRLGFFDDSASSRRPSAFQSVSGPTSPKVPASARGSSNKMLPYVGRVRNLNSTMQLVQESRNSELPHRSARSESAIASGLDRRRSSAPAQVRSKPPVARTTSRFEKLATPRKSASLVDDPPSVPFRARPAPKSSSVVQKPSTTRRSSVQPSKPSTGAARSSLRKQPVSSASDASKQRVLLKEASTETISFEELISQHMKILSSASEDVDRNQTPVADSSTLSVSAPALSARSSDLGSNASLGKREEHASEPETGDSSDTPMDEQLVQEEFLTLISARYPRSRRNGGLSGDTFDPRDRAVGAAQPLPVAGGSQIVAREGQFTSSTSPRPSSRPPKNSRLVVLESPVPSILSSRNDDIFDLPSPSMSDELELDDLTS